MTNDIDEIIQILAGLEKNYLKLKALFLQKYRYISKGDISNLAANISETRYIISKINEMESKRQTVALNIASRNDINSNEVNASFLSSKFPDKANIIQNSSRKILDTISEIKVADKRSNRLIKNSLDQIKWFLTALGQEALSLTSYSFFDKKV